MPQYVKREAMTEIAGEKITDRIQGRERDGVSNW